MKKVPLPVLFFALVSAIPAQNLRIVNAASLAASSIAPGSIISIFGTRLATTPAVADNVKNPPVTLNNVGVKIGGVDAALFFVAPTQINAVVDSATPVGLQTVTVTSPNGTQTVSVMIDTHAPPGLFSVFGTGTRDGAIINAITYELGGFSTQNGVTPTYLSLFATGLDTTNRPVVTFGGVPVPVVFYGDAPCCKGLQQVNVTLTSLLAGSGRVPVVAMANAQVSNPVEVVLLPPTGAEEFPGDPNHGKRSRELSTLVHVTGTSLVLAADENDDVIRVVDVHSRKVTKVIVLPMGASPQGMAVTDDGLTALVAEQGRQKVAVIDIAGLRLTTEIPVGMGPVSIAIAGMRAVVVNGDDDTVSIINLGTDAVMKTIAVGRAPRGVAADATSAKAYVTNSAEGTVSVIDLAALSLTGTLTLDPASRPQTIALLPLLNMAFITSPASGPDGRVYVLDLTAKSVTAFAANPDKTGGSSDIAIYGTKVYFANQTGGSVSAAAVAGGVVKSISTIRADLGVRSLAAVAEENVLVVACEGPGMLVLIDLNTNLVVGRLKGVVSSMNADSAADDHSDRGDSGS